MIGDCDDIFHRLEVVCRRLSSCLPDLALCKSLLSFSYSPLLRQVRHNSQSRNCRSLIKVKFSTDQFNPALGSGCRLSIDCYHAQKPQNCPISDLFNLTTKYFLPLLPYTDLVPPSTDPVPPSTNRCRPILTQYHHGSTITALYWSSATKYQQVEPHTDPVPSCINQYRLLLTQYHQVPNSTAFCWTSTIIYQPVPLHIDPVPPSINQYRPILTQYHQVPTSTASYWPSTTKYQPVPPPTDPVPPSTNQYHLLLTQCHHISTSTASYWPSTTKYQPVPTYTVFPWGLQTPAQFTTGLVFFIFILRWRHVRAF